MSDNRDLTGTFHQKVSSLPASIASDLHEFLVGMRMDAILASSSFSIFYVDF